MKEMIIFKTLLKLLKIARQHMVGVNFETPLNPGHKTFFNKSSALKRLKPKI